jgi:hypothetical protein
MADIALLEYEQSGALLQTYTNPKSSSELILKVRTYHIAFYVILTIVRELENRSRYGSVLWTYSCRQAILPASLAIIWRKTEVEIMDYGIED